MWFIFVILLIIVVVVLKVFLKKVLKPKVKGFVGEFTVNTRLHFLGDNYIVMKDLILHNSNGYTSQIDHIVISEYGIFVIETKNYKGWIFGNEKSDNWTQVIYNEKYYFRNPIKQNYSHICALKNVLAEFPKIEYYPIIVFSKNATLKRIESSKPVIYDYQLNNTIKKFSNRKCLSLYELNEIKLKLETCEVSVNSSKKEHVKNIRKVVVEKEYKKRNLICPRCNGELILRNGKNGKFYGCSNFPKCRFTMSY